QVVDKSNLAGGISRLAQAIERHAPERAEFYFQLAEAWRSSGRLARALPLYREALRRNPQFAVGLRALGSALRRSGQHAEAVEVLKRSAAVAPDNATTRHELGLAYQAQNKM